MLGCGLILKPEEREKRLKMSKSKWYAVHVLPQSEQKVKTLIERTASKKFVQNKIKQILIPMDIDSKKINGKKIEKTVKVFPGYILINMELDDETYTFIKQTPGVTNFVSSQAKKPIALRDEEVQDVINALDPNKGFKPKKVWAKNMLVRVSEGPFSDFTGKIEDVYDEKQKLKVMISLFGRDTPVELEFGQVEKVQ